MRTIGNLRRSCMAALLLGSGCATEPDPDTKPKNEGVEELSIVVEADKSRIAEEERRLSERKESFEAEQQRLERERAELAERLASLSKKDKSQRERLEADEKRLADEAAKLRERAGDFDRERQKLEQDKSRLLERLAKAERSGSPAQREQEVAQREQDLAKREQGFAAREREIAKREAEALALLKSAQELLASAQGSARSAPVAAAAPLGAASKSSVQDLNRRIQKDLRDKGILEGDLSPTTREALREADSATRAKDYGQAQELLGRVRQELEKVTVDGRFINGKLLRYNRSYAGKALDPNKDATAKKLQAQAMEEVADGRFNAANRLVNQMFSLHEGQ